MVLTIPIREVVLPSINSHKNNRPTILFTYLLPLYVENTAHKLIRTAFHFSHSNPSMAGKEDDETGLG
jgi:hypothetical protein